MVIWVLWVSTMACASNRVFISSLAFGLKGRIWVTALFITELITSSVALVVLLGDGIDALFPGFSLKEIRLLSFFILTPMLFLPVRHLSYTSLLGIISAFSIIIVIIVDGVTKKDAPGSLIEPAVSFAIVCFMLFQMCIDNP